MQLELLFPSEYSVVMPILLPIAFAMLAAALSSLSFVGLKRIPKGLPDLIAVFGFGLTFVYIYMLALDVWAAGPQTFVWSSFGGPLGSVMVVDQFSIMLQGLFVFMGLVVALYSIGYMSHDTGLTQYYVLLLIMVGAMNGVVASGDMFTLFLFYETMGLSSFILVAFRRTWEGIEAAIKYLMMSAVGSTLVLFSASYLYGMTGTLNLGAMSVALTSAGSDPLLPILVALMTAGFGVKGAVVPFAAWLADAHPAAPSGISAMLSGVVIKVGVYGIVRMNATLFPVAVATVNWPLLLAIFAIVTMTAGNFWALTQTDLKRMLAYSSITQIGFILFAFGTATEFGFQTGSFYIISHALTKGLLFLCAGAFLHAIGSRDLGDLEGIGKKMPIAGGFFAIGVLSLMGMPPFAGFYAKFLVLAAGADAGISGGYYLLFTFIAIFNAILGLGYYLKMLQVVWFKEPSAAVQSAHRSGISMIVGMSLLAIALIAIGIYPGPIYSIAESAGSALYNFGDYVSKILNVGVP